MLFRLSQCSSNIVCKQHIFIATCAKKVLHISVISVIYKIHSANLFLYSTCIIMLRITSSFPCSKDISPIYILATRRMLFKPIPCSLPDLVVSGKSLSPKIKLTPKTVFYGYHKDTVFPKRRNTDIRIISTYIFHTVIQGIIHDHTQIKCI